MQQAAHKSLTDTLPTGKAVYISQDEVTHDEYLTKLNILEMYDQMAALPSMAHSDRE
jgi:hypothetical protein